MNVSGMKMKVPIQARMFDLQQVRLLDGLFKDAQERDRKYLHDLDFDRLLHNFRVTAGLPSTAEPLGGWERPDCELRGHFVPVPAVLYLCVIGSCKPPRLALTG